MIIKNKKRKRRFINYEIKKQINYDKLFAEFAKILQRDLTKEDKKIIDLAYKMGKTNQFLTESTIYKKR